MNEHLQEYLGGSERYWLLAYPDLTVYGHSIDAWTRRHYPEDIEATRQLHQRGRDFGCWHSRVCPEGELGSNDLRLLMPIDRSYFEQAAERGWPDAEITTTDQPSVQVMVQDDQGNWQEVYNSLEGRTDLATGTSEGQQERTGRAAEDSGGEEPPQADDHAAEVP